MSAYRQHALAAGLLILLGTGTAQAAEAPLPFEGTWVRADRVCSAASPSARTYAGRSLFTPSGRCSIRKVAFGLGEYEIFEDCRRSERSGNVVEKIRMLGPDAMILKYQTNRLKIPRGRRFIRCTVAAPRPASPPPGRTPPPGLSRPGTSPPPHDAE